jgi:phospholipid/cholesterol/gamma-HCH transport system substrate-binding protein
MDSTRAFELKVGAFILIGVAILFMIVFSIGDINLAKSGYHIKVIFNFASGIGPAAPVRLAGVGVGRIDGISLFFDEKDNKTKAMITAWIENGAKIEEDAVVTINTLGLLGEKYLEIYPGTAGKPVIKNEGTIIGKDPIPMERVTDNISRLTDSVTDIVHRIEKGEGTLGKFLTDDSVYNNIESFTEKMNSNKGTIGRLLTDDTIYNKLDGFVEEIKRNPWKLLSRPRGQ